MEDNLAVNFEDEIAQAFAPLRSLTAPEMRRLRQGMPVAIEVHIFDDAIDKLGEELRRLWAQAATAAARQQVIAAAHLAAKMADTAMCFAMMRSGHLNPYLRDKAKSERASIAGKKRAANEKPKVDARHAEVLRLMGEIKSKNPVITQDELATKIVSKLPEGMALGRSRILRIMRVSRQSTG